MDSAKGVGMASDGETQNVIEHQRFDEPLVFKGGVEREPERYVAEKPYELTQYEFSVLRRRILSLFWAQTLFAATAGLVLATVGKVLHALVLKEAPQLESWELWAIIVGLGLSIIFWFIRTKDDQERIQLESAIDEHFTSNKPRRVHLTTGENQ